jgi:hypothetical protein
MEFLRSAEVNLPLKWLFYQEKIAGDFVEKGEQTYIFNFLCSYQYNTLLSWPLNTPEGALIDKK